MCAGSSHGATGATSSGAHDEANEGGRRGNGCSNATGMLTVCHTGCLTSGIHPVAHHVGATGVRSGTGLKRTISCFTKEKSCCLMRRPRGIASLLVGVVLMSLKAFLQVIGVANGSSA